MDTEKLRLVAMMLHDNLDRNAMPEDYSPYKTRQALTMRNAEHIGIVLRVLNEVIRGDES